MGFAFTILVTLCLMSNATSLRTPRSFDLLKRTKPIPLYSSVNSDTLIKILTPSNYINEIEAKAAEDVKTDYLIEFYSPSCIACIKKKPLFEHVSKRLLLLQPRRNVKSYLYNNADHARLMKDFMRTDSSEGSLTTLDSMAGWANKQGFPYVFYLKGDSLDSPVPFDEKLSEASLVAFVEGIIGEKVPAAALPYLDPPDDDDDDDDCDACSL